MALTTLNLTVDLYLNDDCDALILEDMTDLYSLNNLTGYNSPNGVAVNDVTSLIVTLNYTMLAVACVYTFTISSGVITAATINFNGGGAVNILTQLTDTTFPFTSENPFTFFNTYINGSSQVITLPSIEDGAYSVSYNITGSALDIATPTSFDLTATDMVLADCQTCCCINDMFSKVDENCDCGDDKMIKAITAKSYLEIANYAVEVSNSDRANIFINKAKTLCDCDCGC